MLRRPARCLRQRQAEARHPPAPTPARTAKPATVLGPLPAYQRELSGTLLEIPAGADVELALLVIDERDRPQRLLASSNLTGTGQALPYQLRFNPEAFPLVPGSSCAAAPAALAS